MRSLSRTVAVCLLLISLPAAAEETFTPVIEEIARQAPFIVKGKLLPGFRLEVQEQYKGQLPDETISIPDLSHFSELAKAPWAKETYSVRVLRSELSEQACKQLEGHGLIGSTVILFLEKAAEGEGYNLKATTLRRPESNDKHAAIRVLFDNVVLVFDEIPNPGFFQLLVDRRTPTLESLEAAIRYDRPLLFDLGYTSAIGGGVTANYFYFALTNLSNEAIQVDLDENMTLTIKGNAIQEGTEPPKACWKPNTFPKVLLAGELIWGQYRLNKLDPNILELEQGKVYEGTLTIRITKGGEEDIYSGKAVAKID